MLWVQRCVELATHSSPRGNVAYPSTNSPCSAGLAVSARAPWVCPPGWVYLTVSIYWSLGAAAHSHHVGPAFGYAAHRTSFSAGCVRPRLSTVTTPTRWCGRWAGGGRIALHHYHLKSRLWNLWLMGIWLVVYHSLFAVNLRNEKKPLPLAIIGLISLVSFGLPARVVRSFIFSRSFNYLDRLS
jgi:hypothetical protein